MRTALGPMELKPAEFWQLTPAEFWAIYEAKFEKHVRKYANWREDLERLEGQFKERFDK